MLHGDGALWQLEFSFEPMIHNYETEDVIKLREILKVGTYHAVVANPPYITVKDKKQNTHIRERYLSCHGKYALSVPFMERSFNLAINNGKGASGFVGQITANSFMKREFGKKMIKGFFPKIEITHVIDTSLVHLPSYGIPTVILIGRNRSPLFSKIRTAMGIKRESKEPSDPSKGLVWVAIKEQIDRPGTESQFISVTDTNGSDSFEYS